jgi:hypothetical protein
MFQRRVKLIIQGGSFCEEVEHVSDKFPKHHINILLGDFTTKVPREGIFRLSWN